MNIKKNEERGQEALSSQIERVLYETFRRRSLPGVDARQVEELAVRNILRAISIAENEDNLEVRSASSYLRLIRRMLEAVRSGISRNQFLANVFSEINKDEADRTIIVIEGYPHQDSDRVSGLAAPFIVGSNQNRVGNFKKKLRGFEESGFLIGLLVHRNGYDFDLQSILTSFGTSENAVYRDELADLHGNSEAWICALALPASEAGEPERALVAIYPAPERSYSPSIPPGAKQEWDILRLLPDIFSLLQHRTRSFRDQVAEDQRKLISELAPSAIMHELGTSLSLMESALGRTTKHFNGLRNDLGGVNEHLLELARELSLVRNRIEHAKLTTDAFTNLERRNPLSRVDLHTLIGEVGTVLKQRLNRANVTLTIDIPTGLDIVIDARFVEHVVMNVIINAIEAIEPIVLPQRERGEAVDVHTIAIEARGSGNEINLVIANDGPEIPVSIAARVFEKGITTKPLGVGHGQGLYLCRQIAQHLGGNFGFGGTPELLPEANVSFRLSVPKVARYESDT
ncbi:ATP-binding protein [Bradyrhizobium sp.]